MLMSGQIMQTHTTMGHEILQGCETPYMKMGAEIALMHHEAWDGSGYPLGLKRRTNPHVLPHHGNLRSI